MNKLLKIGDIYIDFTYQFDSYFKDVVNAYQVDEFHQDNYKLIVSVEKDLREEEKENKFVYNDNIKWSDSEETSIITHFPDGRIKSIISYKNDYSIIKITLSEELKDKLPEYEYVLSGKMFFEIALKKKYLPIHASAIKVNGKAVLLSGPSKSGKSTQTEYFLDLNKNAYVINEDKPLLKIEDERVFVLGTPWSGKHVINANEKVLLQGIYFLNKSTQTSIDEIDRKTKLKLLMKNIHRPNDEESIDNMIEVINNLIDLGSIYHFDCENNINSARVLQTFLEDQI
jgi:serine kinase of HPr protein (carbohydrate metabolism regulator)